MRTYRINEKEIKPHNILYCVTSEMYYEMERLMLLEDMPDTESGEYVLVEGDHCSCYGFDDTCWDATVYTGDELVRLLSDCENYELRLKLKEFLRYYGWNI